MNTGKTAIPHFGLITFRKELMSNALNPLVNMYQSYLEASGQFAAISFSIADKISHTSLMAAHHAFNEQLKLAHALATTHEPEDAQRTPPLFFVDSSAMNIDSQNQMLRLAGEVQKEFGNYFQRYMAQVKSITGN